MNAVDAINQGGSIHVRIRATRQWPTGKSGIRIMIADSGTGISPESRSRIFEPFFSTKQDAGNGLGLWISRGIVQKHGGSIRVRSRVAGPYRGTAFSVFLPSAHAASQVA
jgi:signal transduction histidine kinase